MRARATRSRSATSGTRSTTCPTSTPRLTRRSGSTPKQSWSPMPTMTASGPDTGRVPEQRRQPESVSCRAADHRQEEEVQEAQEKALSLVGQEEALQEKEEEVGLALLRQPGGFEGSRPIVTEVLQLDDLPVTEGPLIPDVGLNLDPAALTPSARADEGGHPVVRIDQLLGLPGRPVLPRFTQLPEENT